jgi:hypothetical protein
MVRVKVLLAAVPMLLEASTINVVEPSDAALAIPLSSPVVDRLRPLGRLPETTLKVG